MCTSYQPVEYQQYSKCYCLIFYILNMERISNGLLSAKMSTEKCHLIFKKTSIVKQASQFHFICVFMLTLFCRFSSLKVMVYLNSWSKHREILYIFMLYGIFSNFYSATKSPALSTLLKPRAPLPLSSKRLCNLQNYVQKHRKLDMNTSLQLPTRP